MWQRTHLKNTILLPPSWPQLKYFRAFFHCTAVCGLCVFNMIMGIRTLMWKSALWQMIFYSQVDSPQRFQSFSMCTVYYDHGNQNIDVKKCKNITLPPSWTHLKYFRAFFHCSTNHVPCVLCVMIMGIRTLIWKKCTFEKYNFIPHPAGLTSNISEHSFTAQQYVDCVFNMIMGIRTLIWKKEHLWKYNFTFHLAVPQIFQSFHCTTSNGPNMYFWGVLCLTI